MLKSQGSIEGNLQQIPVNKIIGKNDVYKVLPTLNNLQKIVYGAGFAGFLREGKFLFLF